MQNQKSGKSKGNGNSKGGAFFANALTNGFRFLISRKEEAGELPFAITNRSMISFLLGD